MEKRKKLCLRCKKQEVEEYRCMNLPNEPLVYEQYCQRCDFWWKVRGAILVGIGTGIFFWIYFAFI
ncbi:MAG: hypothetical protein AAB456_03430 [Patescibacteria group bacterium]